MNRNLLVCTLMVAASAAVPAIVGAQQTSQPDSYQGTSNPPPDDTITTPTPAAPVAAPVIQAAPQAKPSAYGRPVQTEPPYQGQPQYQNQAQVQDQNQAQVQGQPLPQQGVVRSAFATPEDGTDSGIVEIAPDTSATAGQPGLRQRDFANDPDGDIVHPAALAPGELGEGATIRVRLLDRLSTSESKDGDAFHSRVASDVLQGGQVLIPAGSEIDGRVMNVSTGTLGGHGSMRLNPETVILPDGSRYRLYAQVSGTPGSNTRVGNEGAINPGSRLKRNSIEYGGGVGAGVVAGAAIGGPVGALTGSIVGAGLVTVHLLVNHPQAHLEEGTVLLFTLTERLHLEPVNASGS